MVEPAPPILGLTLLTTKLAKTKAKPIPASIGSTTVDEALHGGLRYGEITSIAGANGMGKTLFALHAIATHIMANENGEVAFIDTTGSFSPLRLRDVIVHRLSHPSNKALYQQSGYVYERIRSHPKAETLDVFREKATLMLDRVRVMRVFDYAGAVEAIGEVSERCDEYERSQGAVCQNHVSENVTLVNEIEKNQEGDDEESDKLDISVKPVINGGIGMVIIDNIASVLSPMLSKNQTEAQALLTTSIRFLQHLTQTHFICTILLNAAVALNATSQSMYPRSYRASDNASIFTSTSGKPALGRTYAYLIDTSVLLSSIPKAREDAAAAFGGSGSGAERWESVGIVEVLRDRYGDREGEWAAFEISAGVELKGYV